MHTASIFHRHTLTLALAAVFAASSPVTLGGCSTTESAGEQLDDEALAQAVGTALALDEGVRRVDVDVDVLAGVVYLRGEVDTETMRERAEEVTLAVDGVHHVENQLEVGAPDDLATSSADALITSTIAARLVADPDTRLRNIDVDTQDSVVTLSGIVEDEVARRRAVELASKTRGVLRVVDDLQVAQEK
ncbi:MAG: BON domain-containing protein [Nannocystaceae bacterium]|nr:BON domain-containing protein [Myxococcales bacterium]